MNCNNSHSSSDRSCLIHEMACAFSRDLDNYYPNRAYKKRTKRYYYRLYDNILSDDPSWAIAQIREFEMQILNSNQDIVRFLDKEFNIPDDVPVIHFIRQSMKVLWKNTTTAPNSDLNKTKARISRSGSPSLDVNQKKELRRIIKDLLGPCPDLMSLTPKHGPGAVAQASGKEHKWEYLQDIPAALIPYGGVQLFRANPHHIAECGSFSYVKHMYTRFVEVPKDIRGNRGISCEPAQMQFQQQAMMSYLMRRVNWYSKDQIKFDSQGAHQSFMIDGGHDYSTIDLKDASDMVSRRLIWNLFPREWREILFSLRTPFMKIHDEIIPIRAFAPMGSALCFPIESIVFYALCRLCTNKPISVYGDDLIIPVSSFRSILTVIEQAGLSINVEKSCYTGRFRETCGKDILLTYDADVNDTYDISIQNLRARLPFRSVHDIPGLISICNEWYDHGWWNISLWLQQESIKQFPRQKCVWSQDSNYTFPHDHGLKAQTRWNTKLQRSETKVQLLDVPICSKTPNNYWGLFSAFIASGLRSEVSYTPSGYVNNRLICRWVATVR